MPFNGSGGTSQPASSIYPASANTLIESAKFNISIADIYTMLASCIVKDGQTTTTAAVPFASGIKTDDINENTVGDGVTIDGALIKDGRIDTTQGADIASAATINLETATGNVVDVTGTTGITAVTLSQGHWRLVRFTGALTITNGASLVLPNAANYTTSAGDYVLFVGYASSVVRAYILPTNGPIPFVDSQPIVVGSADKTKKVRLEVDGLTAGTTRVLTIPDADGTLITSTNPFPDSSAVVAGSADATKKIRFEVDGLTTATTRVLTPPDQDSGVGLYLGTEQAATSGTAIDFTSIPVWAKKITVQFVGVSTSGTDNIYIQLGDAGGVETTGYLGASTGLAAGVTSTNYTAAFGISLSGAANVVHGSVTLTLEDSANFTWVASGVLATSNAAATATVAGSKSLSAALDRVRITTAGGTDTFDAGAINIICE